MTGTCDVCRVVRGRHLFDSLKESGGGAVHCCDDCVEWLRVSVEKSASGHCCICSTDASDKYEIVKHGVPKEPARSAICSECRKRLVFNHGEPVFISKKARREAEQ